MEGLPSTDHMTMVMLAATAAIDGDASLLYYWVVNENSLVTRNNSHESKIIVIIGKLTVVQRPHHWPTDHKCTIACIEFVDCSIDSDGAWRVAIVRVFVCILSVWLWSVYLSLMISFLFQCCCCCVGCLFSRGGRTIWRVWAVMLCSLFC